MLDGTYTWMLRSELGVSLKRAQNKQRAQQKTAKLWIRRYSFIGNIQRKKEELSSKGLVWEPKYGKQKRRRLCGSAKKQYWSEE